MKLKTQVVAALAAAAFSFPTNANELDSLRDLQLQLLERFDLLEQEVQMLRGVVEEQARTIESLEQDGRSRYLDLDQRISALGTVPAVVDNAPVVAASGSEPIAAPEPSQPLGDPALENERYQAAFNLIRSREFDQAQSALNEFIQQYPTGKLLPDAKYWLAQVHEAVGESDRAIESFTALLADHPEYRRAPQSQLKLGRLLLDAGQTERGQQVLAELIAADEQSELATQARELLQSQ